MRCAQTSRFGDRRSSRRTADRCAAQGGSEGCERGRGSGAHRLAPGAAVTSRSGAVGGSSAEASCSAAPPTAPLPSRRVEASRGRCRWCGGGEGSSAGSESDLMNRATKTARHVRALAGLEARSPCAACPVCVSASPRSRSTVRESGSGPRYHGSDGVLPSGRDRREAGGGAAAADAAAAQSCSCSREVAHSSKAASATAALALSPRQTPRRVSAAAAASPRE